MSDRQPEPLSPGKEKKLHDDDFMAWLWYRVWKNDTVYRRELLEALPDERREAINRARGGK